MLRPFTNAKIASTRVNPPFKSAPHQRGALVGVLARFYYVVAMRTLPFLPLLKPGQGLQIKALNMLNCLLNWCPSSRHASLRSFEYARRSDFFQSPVYPSSSPVMMISLLNKVYVSFSTNMK
jgi:hypothetical protein